MAADRYDTIVVGAGILGLAVARELLARRHDERVLVVEREAAPAAHQSSHNSGVIHGGIYYAPGSIKARLCVDGAARMVAYCEQREIAVRRLGKLIVALRPGEIPALDELERRAHANGVPGIRRLDDAGLREVEPHATGIAALHAPGTAVVDFGEICRALAEDVRADGGELRCAFAVTGVATTASTIHLTAADGNAAEARRAIFCAGLWSDRLAVLAGADPDPRIVPFRGAYLRLTQERRHLVQGLIYPVPDPRLPFLGIHLTPTVGDDVLLGPTALLVPSPHALTWPGTPRMLRRHWRTGANELRLATSRTAFATEASRYVPGITPGDLVPAFAGIRAQAIARDGGLVDDFLLSTTPRAIHVRNAPSPAATSSLALAALIADRADELT